MILSNSFMVFFRLPFLQTFYHGLYIFSAIELDAERFAFSGKDDVCLLRELLPASKEESVQQILLRNVSWVLAHPEDFQGRIRQAAEEYMDRLK